MSPLVTRSFGDVLANSASELAKRATYTITETEHYYTYGWTRTIVIVYFIILAVLIGGSAIGALLALVVWYVREQKRKKWYGPMAQYYRERGFGRTGMIPHNGAMYVPQVIYVPFGGQPGVPQPPPGPIVGVPMPYPQPDFRAPGNQPQLPPLNTSVAHARDFGNGAGNDTTGDVAAGISERDIAGPISPIRDFNGAGAYDPFASPRISRNVENHGVNEVHGAHGAQEMSEKGDVGLTRASHSLSFYAGPVGSHTNLPGAGSGASNRY